MIDPMINLQNLTIEKAHSSLSKSDFTVMDLASAYINIIKEKNPDINAYLEV